MREVTFRKGVNLAIQGQTHLEVNRFSRNARNENTIVDEEERYCGCIKFRNAPCDTCAQMIPSNLEIQRLKFAGQHVIDMIPREVDVSGRYPAPRGFLAYDTYRFYDACFQPSMKERLVHSNGRP